MECDAPDELFGYKCHGEFPQAFKDVTALYFARFCFGY